jgi:hypothetical protein
MADDTNPEAVPAMIAERLLRISAFLVADPAEI